MADAAGIYALRHMPGVFENILGTPAESLSAAEKFLAGLNNSMFQFSAVIRSADGEEKVIGTAGLQVAANPRRRHSGEIGIMVHKDYQELGVGSALMAAVIDMADNWLKLVRVELTVYEDNPRAIALYEKFGFEREGVKRASAKKNGAYVNEIVMARIKY